MLMSAKTRQEQQALPTSLVGRYSVDVRAVCPELFLSLRATQDDADALWMRGHGVCSTARSRRATLRSLGDGLPCVLLIKDAGLEMASSNTISVVDTLQLEIGAREEAFRWHR